MRKVIALSLVAMFTVLATLVAHAAEKSSAVIGQAAPSFSLQDQNGKTVSLSDFAGKIVVLEWWNNECPIVQRHYKAGTMNTLSSKYSPKDVVWLAINSTKDKTNADNMKAAMAWNMDRPVLNDATGSVGHKYGATNTPNMFIIDKDGKLAYIGAIDNDPQGDMSTKLNYVDKALSEITNGAPVSQPQTKPYGCSIKYAN